MGGLRCGKAEVEGQRLPRPVRPLSTGHCVALCDISVPAPNPRASALYPRPQTPETLDPVP
eukprot:3936930-Rhodomonas_salina.1